MTGFTYDVQRFDTWIGNNYTELLKYCKRYHILEDELHDTYLNCKQRIIKSGFTETYAVGIVPSTYGRPMLRTWGRKSPYSSSI